MDCTFSLRTRETFGVKLFPKTAGGGTVCHHLGSWRQCGLLVRLGGGTRAVVTLKDAAGGQPRAEPEARPVICTLQSTVGVEFSRTVAAPAAKGESSFTEARPTSKHLPTNISCSRGRRFDRSLWP